MYDLVIKNAKVVDGTGNPWFFSDVAVKDGIIVKVGALRDFESKEVFDANGLILTPGFIDVHTHSDFTLFENPLAESRVLQGVTTDISGHCGISAAPLVNEKKDLLAKYTQFLNDQTPFAWNSMKEFLDYIESKGTSVNYGTLVGHGTIRIIVAGFEDRKLTSLEISRMQELTKQAMEDGAFGISAGLIYPPGCYSDEEELAEIIKVIAEYGGIFTIHMRDERDDVLGSMNNLIKIAKKSKVPVHISHHKVMAKKHWGALPHATIALLKRTREEGIDISLDQYPYDTGSSTLSIFLPDWALEGGNENLVLRLKDTEIREKIKREISDKFEKDEISWEEIVVSVIKNNKSFRGKSICQIADILCKSPVDAALDLLIEENGSIGCFFLTCDKGDIETILKYSNVMIGSDGMAISEQNGESMHPRCFGTFPRIIGHYCRDKKVITLEDAIRKMTSLGANRLGIFDRGMIRPGMKADIVLFNYEKINDRADSVNPNRQCEGIINVYVNGVLTVKEGKHTGAKAGEIIRKNIYYGGKQCQ